MTETLNVLETLVLQLGETGGFQALGPLAERHGSWEIVLWKNSAPDNLDRFVSLAITEVGSRYEIELRAGAEHQGRFARNLVEEFAIDALDLRLRVSQGLERAMAVVEGFEAGQLVDTYLPERFQAQRGASAD
jgi:hypothetical protein